MYIISLSVQIPTKCHMWNHETSLISNNIQVFYLIVICFYHLYVFLKTEQEYLEFIFFCLLISEFKNHIFKDKLDYATTERNFRSGALNG